MPARKPIVYRVTENGCWEVTSHCTWDGYPLRTQKFKRILMHREAYEKAHGPIPKGMVVRHKCDNRRCINPDHLELGTHADNVRDRVERGRSAWGERMGNAVLSKEQALEIKRDRTTPTRFLAAKYNVCKSTIRDIRSGKRWIYLED